MKSITNTLDVLEVFWLADNEISLSELTRLTGLKRTTAGRIVTVLLERDYIQKSKRTAKYTLGKRSILIGSHIRHKMTLRDVAMPHLIELADKVKESVTLFSFDSDMPYLVEEIHTNNPLRVIPDRAFLSPPLYNSAYGKIFLASKSDHELNDYLDSETLQPYTPNSITDINHYKNHLQIVAREGIAYDDEECYLGMRNVAAGIKNAEGDIVSCVCVMGPSVRLSRVRMTQIVPDVIECASAISRVLGYREASS